MTRVREQVQRRGAHHKSGSPRPPVSIRLPVVLYLRGRHLGRGVGGA